MLYYYLCRGSFMNGRTCIFLMLFIGCKYGNYKNFRETQIIVAEREDLQCGSKKYSGVRDFSREIERISNRGRIWDKAR